MTKRLSREEYLKTLPRKIVGTAALISDQNDRYIIGYPSYRDDGWMLPGGILEDGEVPSEGIKREVYEEIGLELENLEMVGTSYTNFPQPKGDLILYIFACKPLSEDEIESISTDKEEWKAAEWVSKEELVEKLILGQKKLAETYFSRKDDSLFYLENGELVA